MPPSPPSHNTTEPTQRMPHVASRLVLITTTLEGGGAARVLVHMANHWVAAGRHVTLLSFEDGSSPSFYPLDSRVTVRYLALNRYSPHIFASIANNWRRLKCIRRAVLTARPDALISFIDTANVRTILAMLGTGVPLAISERVHPAYEDIGPVWSLLRRLTYPLATSLVVQTRQIADHCAGWGVRHIEVIPNPVQSMPTLGGAPELPQLCLLAVGRLYPQKDYPLMLRAFAATSARRQGWTLCIAGEGPQRRTLERQICELGLGDSVQLLGQVADMGGLLQQARAYVMASRYEGFPNSLCEAMAAGLPCISTDCPSGPAEVITNEENGLLVPSGNEAALAAGLERLMSDEALRQRLGECAQELSKRFSLESVMALWDGALARAMGKETP